MTILDQLRIQPTVDDILHAQGVDPHIVRSRRPMIAQTAELALQAGLPLLQPSVSYNTLSVDGISHNRIMLSGRHPLRSVLLAQEMKNAKQLYLCVCSIGTEIQKASREAMEKVPALGMALDAMGSAAVELLISETCKYFENLIPAGWYLSQPLGPGMEGWPVSEGQPQIFQLVDTQPIGVTLTESFLMLPIKSASFVLGSSPHPFNQSSICDFCNVRETCRYRGRSNHG